MSSILKRESKKRVYYIHQYIKARQNNIDNLDKCYKDYSYNKLRAFNRCVEYMQDCKGYKGFILSYNSMQFTFGFLKYNKNSLNYDLIVITKTHIYEIPDCIIC